MLVEALASVLASAQALVLALALALVLASVPALVLASVPASGCRRRLLGEPGYLLPWLGGL